MLREVKQVPLIISPLSWVVVQVDDPIGLT